MKTVKVANRGRNVISTSTLTLDSNCNKSIGGADRKDALIGNYLSVRKTRKWAANVVLLFIEEAVLSLFILYDKVNPGNPGSSCNSY